MWYGLGLLGALLAAVGFAPFLKESLPATSETAKRPLWWRLGAMLVGAGCATVALWLVGNAGLELPNLLGMVVGGYLLIWFGVAGLVSLLLLWTWPGLPSRRSLLGGLFCLAILWLGVGLLGQLVWLPWFLIPRRLLLWPLGAALCLPWFLAAGQAAEGAGALGRLGWWLAHSLAVAGGAFLAVTLSPGLGFLVLILPLFPAILGFHAISAGPLAGRWSFALSGALFTSWLLLAVFPVL
jgi:hypothetical protein